MAESSAPSIATTKQVIAMLPLDLLSLKAKQRFDGLVPRNDSQLLIDGKDRIGRGEDKVIVGGSTADQSTIGSACSSPAGA